jgi:hypothetical protein
MFWRASEARSETVTPGAPEASSLWGFRRRAPVDPVVTAAPAEEATFVADAISAGFEVFGRAGLQLGGLHRDQQWVGAWGGRC